MALALYKIKDSMIVERYIQAVEQQQRWVNRTKQQQHERKLTQEYWHASNHDLSLHFNKIVILRYARHDLKYVRMHV